MSPVVLLLGVLWLAALGHGPVRNRRFVAALAFWSAAELAATRLPPETAWPAYTGLFVIGLVGIAWGHQLGLGRLTPSEWKFLLRFSTIERRVANCVDAGDDCLEQERRQLIDDIGALQPPGVALRVPMHLLRLAWSAELHDQRLSSSLPWPSPRQYERAGRRFLQGALYWRLLDPPHITGAWDEGIALRGLLTTFRGTLPPNALGEQPSEGPTGWRAVAESVLRDIQHLGLRHPETREVRGELVKLLKLELELASGDRTPRTREDYETAAANVDRIWGALNHRLSRARSVP